MKFDDVLRVVEPVGGRAATGPVSGKLLYDFVVESGAESVLELGFAHGNSTCYLAAALHELGRGSVLTIDREDARDRKPNILELLRRTDLEAFATPVFAHTSYNWELLHLLEQQRVGHDTQPMFDFAFIDGAHTWEVDGLAFFLVDKLLRPGGWVLFDDVHWTLGASPTLRNSARVLALSEEERRTPQILRVFSHLVMQHKDYDSFTVKGNWAWAHKKPDGDGQGVGADVMARLYAPAADDRSPHQA